MANGAPGDSRVPAWRWRYGRHQRGDPGAAGAGGPVVLDVHLGALARRLRLAGIDAACVAPVSNRNLLDFISETVDPTTGCAHVAYADDNQVNMLRVANQDSGANILGLLHGPCHNKH
jgi:hypothetical protein